MKENTSVRFAEEDITRNGQKITMRCIAVECNFYNKRDCICGLKGHLIDDGCDGKCCILMRIADKLGVEE